MTERKILVLGGGIDSLAILRRLKEMDLHTTVFDKDLNAPAKQLADEFIPLSCYHPWPILQWLARRNDRYAGVICAGVDSPTTMAALSGSVYVNVGRPKMLVAKISQNKWAQKVVFSDAGIKVPAWTTGKGEDVATSTRVVKPVSQRGSKGIMRVLPGEPLAPALQYARDADPGGQVLVEDWIDGIQLSSESIVQEGKLLFTAFSQRNYNRLEETHPYVIEDGGDMPPYILRTYENDYDEKARKVLQACVKALGMDFGTLKGDLIWDGQAIWVVEVATRLSGGNFCSVQIPWVWGVDFVGLAAWIAIGEHISRSEIKPYQACFMSQRFVISPGIASHPERGKGFIGFGVTREQAISQVNKQLIKGRCAHVM